MDRLAFAPITWDEIDKSALFIQHEEAVPLFPQKNEVTLDPISRWQDRTKAHDWEMDFSSTYFLHAFHNHAPALQGFKGLSVQYLLDRKSNYAIAAWHIAQMGVKEGVFVKGDETLT
jgi:hypothetical protein